MRLIIFNITLINIIWFASGFYASIHSPSICWQLKDKLPLKIHYIGEEIPDDSIQQFIKTYFKYKKVDIINEKQGRELMAEQVLNTTQEWMKSGKLKNVKSLQDPILEEYKQELLRPVYNLFRLKFFSSSVNNQYYIDSIHWQVLNVPGSDTAFIANRYLPISVKNQNVYTEIKEFLDQVINSLKK